MLVSFSVSNFRSFGEEVTLDMRASNKLTAHSGHRVPIGNTGKHVLRAALIYGANAAGKSNLVKAMSAAQQLIQGNRAAAVIPSFAPFYSPAHHEKDTSFEFRFLLSDRIFTYGFDCQRGMFTSEWLSVVNRSNDELIFQRDRNGVAKINQRAQNIFQDDSVTFKTLSTLQVLPLRPDQLLLNRAMELPVEAQGATLSSVIKWLAFDLLVMPINYRTCDLLDRLDSDEAFRRFCSGFLRNVGTGVDELLVLQTEREGREHERRFLSQYTTPYNPGGCEGDMDIRLSPNDPTKVIERRLVAVHKTAQGQFALPFSEESDGTQSLLRLLPALSSSAEQNKIIVIDELDRSLHPLICWEFIRFFSESCPGARRQLIVTTQEAHLLNQDLLRRDEYWFVEKDETQQSRLASLSEYNIRGDTQIQKGYLSDRFGAIPIIGGMQELESLLQCNQELIDAEKATPT